MNTKLIIFDLDGTILNTLDDLADSLNEILKRHNMPGHSYEEVKYMVGNGIRKLIERAVPEGCNNPLYEKIYADYVEYYGAHSSIKTCPYKGLTEVLKEFKACGIKLAVNTNKVEGAAVDLCNKYFPGIFDAVCGSTAERPVKPAPDGVFAIYEKLGLNQNEVKNCAVYVGDSDVDIITGKNAGIKAVGVSWGFRGKSFLLENGAEFVVDSAEELKAFILN